MMGMRMPETCWAVFKRQAINLRDWCIWLVDLFEYMMTHGLTNPIFYWIVSRSPSVYIVLVQIHQVRIFYNPFFATNLHITLRPTIKSPKWPLSSHTLFPLYPSFGTFSECALFTFVVSFYYSLLWRNDHVHKPYWNWVLSAFICSLNPLL